MDFEAFDKQKLDEYAARARASWGATPEYREFEERNSGKTLADQTGTGTWLEGRRFEGGVSGADLTAWVDSMGQEMPQ